MKAAPGSACGSADLTALARLFRAGTGWRLVVPLPEAASLMGLQESDAADRLAGWAAAGLVDVWPEAPGGPAVCPSPTTRQLLGAWDEADPRPRRPGLFTDVGGRDGSGLDPDHLAAPPSRSADESAWHAIEEKARAGRARVHADWAGLPTPRVRAGLSTPWGVPDIDRHKIDGPAGGGCGACEGLAFAPPDLCLVCGRLGIEAIIGPIRPRRLSPAPASTRPKFKPRTKAGKRAV